MEILEGVIRLGLRPRQITPSSISIIIFFIRYSASFINPTISRFASRLLRLSHNSTITANDIIIIFHDQNEHHNFNDITLV